ncbi:MAG: 4Fe-4S binding protein [Actinobacteria bacterium]|nr:4Fe-4S binding protein [Actinomycetota bacterium]
MKKLLSGNEAIGYGAYLAGCGYGVGYPGTPSTEILQAYSTYPGVHAEWATNEKVALDVATGISYAGERVFCTMKHVGLNVAADSLFSIVFTGPRGGLVVAVADDPGMHSSQNEQDTRQYGRFAKLPVVEPGDSAEGAEFMKAAFELSEQFKTPVILRSVTRLSHSRTPLEVMDELVPLHAAHETVKYDRDPSRQIPLPMNARRMHREVEQKMLDISAWAETCELNRIEPGDSRLGIVASGIAYQYAREVFPDATFLKLGLAYPLPTELFHTLAGMVDQVVVVEELDPIYEHHIRLLGIPARGKDIFPLCGEFSTELVRARAVTAGLVEARVPVSTGGAPIVFNGLPEGTTGAAGSGDTTAAGSGDGSSDAAGSGVAGNGNGNGGGDVALLDPATLPGRPPMLCPGCAHRPIFYVLQRLRAMVFGDIGCYTLGAAPPLNATHTCGAMGAGIGVVHGTDLVGVKDRTVAVIGDSTFFHGGLPPLVNIAYNKGVSTVIVLDNRITAMTGHQANPATGATMMGDESPTVSIEAVARAFGFSKVDTLDPYDLDEVRRVLKDHLDSSEPSVVVARYNCVLQTKERNAAPHVDLESCNNCGTCLNIGCAPIINRGDHVEIDDILCNGCNYCVTVCPRDAIVSNRTDGGEE